MRNVEVMKDDLVTVSPDDTAMDAARLMRDENVGFLPVCDETGTVLGTLTDRDLSVRVLAAGLASDTPVSDVMTDEVISVSPDADLREAEKLMQQHHKSRMLCIDDSGKLCGVISLSDVAQVEKGGRASETLRRVSEREASLTQ